MGSEGEPSVGGMCRYMGEPSPMLHGASFEKKMLKFAGLSRNSGEKIKRKRLSLYARPGRVLEVGKMADSDAAGALAINAIAGVKSEDHVMVGEGFGWSLTPNSAKPNPLTGPQEEAHQEQ
jgi:hypothetical protein